MKIGSRLVGAEHPPLVIAEIGINHGGSLAVAKRMVTLARDAGCEIVKHQTHFVDDEMTEEAKSTKPPNAGGKSIWDVIAESALSRDEERELQRHARNEGIIYISTPFSRSAADFLNELDVPCFKIGSGECNNLPLVRHIAALGKPVILSTGMNTIESIAPAVEALEGAGVDYALLECTNLYPSPPEMVSLKGIEELSNAFPRAVIGFSDHSIGPTMALAAVALGAAIVERHFTDSRYREGPDISCSMDPAELRFLIDRSREIHVARNNPKHRKPAEEPVYRFARSSVVADRDLAAGTTIEDRDIWARRPGTGEISGADFYKVVGRRLKVARQRNEQIRWSDLGE